MVSMSLLFITPASPRSADIPLPPLMGIKTKFRRVRTLKLSPSTTFTTRTTKNKNCRKQKFMTEVCRESSAIWFGGQRMLR